MTRCWKRFLMLHLLIELHSAVPAGSLDLLIAKPAVMPGRPVGRPVVSTARLVERLVVSPGMRSVTLENKHPVAREALGLVLYEHFAL